ncbi:hypothetical protein Pla110_40550 [Polystyrenella longa]|uniref:Glycosyl hydrolase family 32 N-terminal domain-containing protein n=1 Tax=Polystyrenella longa TaxID=2528007 RepID=A0A518CSV1_9PLAN|nr:glycosyl hydrolase [Polystyrenella longa]QDU82300.1 hypothetical protein Pla110_40550 [Polystyrenella longa]
MYSEAIGTRKTLGDVDVYYHEGIYHLFHLVLPNHDYIAHAVSNDCFSWRRVENAIHIGHPGSFDDSMLWTSHISAHPYKKGWWRMFYTGLSRCDRGGSQRIGMAESDDLYCWQKTPINWEDRRSPLPYDLPGRPPQPPFDHDASSDYPLSPPSEFYESKLDEGRHWVSWRDPFYFREGDRAWLLTAGRVNHGPVVRRGCVAQMEEVAPNQFEARPALHHPGLYDDVEVPNLLKINGEHYLIGSIREDAKVRYWHTKRIGDPWMSYADNVLLPSGNYAGRICKDDKGFLLFSFYTQGGVDRTSNNLMPPPKRIEQLENGHLAVRTFEGFASLMEEEVSVPRVCPLKDTSDGSCILLRDKSLQISNTFGYQIFALEEDLESFQLEATIQLSSEGKFGLVFRVDRETHDGYYISLDLFKGVAQLRSWGTGEDGSGENMMQFHSLQAGYWVTDPPGLTSLKLVAYGSYLELSIADNLILSLADQTFEHGALGFAVESAEAIITDFSIHRMQSPVQADEHLANG